MPEQFYAAESYRARDSVGYLIRRLTTILSGRIESAFANREFTLTQWSVLMHLRDGLAVTASDLCTAFQHDSGALTRLLDQLEQRGLVARRRSLRDRRVVELRLTPAGHKTLALLLPVVVAELNAALAPLSRTEFEQFRGSLLKVLGHLQQERPAVAPSDALAEPKRPRMPRRAKDKAAPRASKRSAGRRA